MSALSSVGSGSAASSTNTGSSSTGSSSTGSSSSGITGLNTSGIQFTGLVSGLDTNQIIQGLLAVQQAKVTDLTNQDNQLVSEQTAFQTLQAKLLDLQQNTSPLTNPIGNVFDARTATSSNQNLVTASAASGAPAGVYSFTVTGLAQAEQLASQGFQSTNSAIAEGTLQIQVGSGTTNTITVNSSNNTLQGLADAINNLDGDVTASVVNDGSSGSPYHLLLTSNQTGLANTINITNTLTDTSAGGTSPDLSTVVQAAANSSIQIGSGPGALTVTSLTNDVEGAFNGVTLNLLGADPNQPVTVTVANDSASATTAVQNFVTSYNALIDYINQNDTYDAQSGQAGVFLGNSAASGIERAVTNAVLNPVPGLPAQANNLSAIGITVDAQGDLSIDQNTLTQALSGQLSGVTSADVRNLFGLTGQSTNPGVQFVYATDQTKATQSPVQVQVTQAATQATLVGEALSAPITIDGTNNTLALSVDGQSANITLAQGTYTTPQALAQELQSELNNSSALSGTSTQVSVDSSNRLNITSQTYGSSSKVSVTGALALGALRLTSGTSAQGVDVAGNYIVNGVTEAAQGQGQLLTGDSTNANTSGLEVRVTLSLSQITATPEANLTVTQGIASQLNQAANSLVDPVTGQLQDINQSFQSSEAAIQQQITAQNAYIQAQQQALLTQFANMEATLAKLQTAGNILTQFANTTKISSTSSTSSFSPSSTSSSSLA